MKKQLLIILTALSATAAASAQLINYTFSNGAPTAVNGLEGVAGLGAGTTWNTGNNVTSPTLVDSTSAASTVSFTMSGSNFGTIKTEGGWNINDLAIFEEQAVANVGGGAARGSQIDFTITGLTVGGTYDVWLYANDSNNSDNERFGQTITTGASSQILDNNADPKNDTSFSNNANYVLFAGLVADGSGNIDFDIVGKAAGAQAGFVTTTSALRPALSGFQIQAVPEPSAFALLAGCFGLTWVMVRRRG